MATVFQRASSFRPFPWKLFVAVMLIIASITAAAIVLTLKANPRHNTVRVPSPQPVSRLIFQVQTNHMPERAL